MYLPFQKPSEKGLWLGGLKQNTVYVNRWCSACAASCASSLHNSHSTSSSSHLGISSSPTPSCPKASFPMKFCCNLWSRRHGRSKFEKASWGTRSCAALAHTARSQRRRGEGCGVVPGAHHWRKGGWRWRYCCFHQLWWGLSWPIQSRSEQLPLTAGLEHEEHGSPAASLYT